MYRRVNSGRFIGVTTLGIVIIMSVFTWVMYGMAQQVFTMTDVMVELNESMKSMVAIQVSMASDIHVMSVSIPEMNDTIAAMDQSVGSMNSSIRSMSGAVQSMAVDINRMTYNLGQATQAFSQPMSYMWGNPFSF